MNANASASRMLELWLACHTQEEIAKAVGYSQDAISKFIETSGFTTNGQVSVYRKTAEIDDEDGEEVRGFGRLKLTAAQWALARHEDADFEPPAFRPELSFVHRRCQFPRPPSIE